MATRTLADALADAARAEVLAWEAAGATPTWSEIVTAYIVVQGFLGTPGARAAAAGEALGYSQSSVQEWLRDRDPPPWKKAAMFAATMGFPVELVRRSLKVANAVRPRQDAPDHRPALAGD